MTDVKLRAATIADIGTIADLATITWNQHYPSIIGKDQIDYMLNMMYSEDSLRNQIVEKGHRFFLLQWNGRETGFISVNEENKNEWFLNKFYIDQNHAAKGMGTQAFSELLKLIQPLRITLTVNRKNFKSINFYFKCGFKIERVADFDIGNGYVMNDFVMVWRRS